MRFNILFVVIISVFLGIVTFCICKIKKYNNKRIVYISLLIMYIVGVFGVTILCKFPGERMYSLIPFSAYAMNFQRGNTWFFKQELFNILMFIPFGVIVGIKKNLKQTVLFGFSFSLIIEIIQFITARGSFDVNDLIWNTFGTLIGCFIIKAIINRMAE